MRSRAMRGTALGPGTASDSASPSTHTSSSSDEAGSSSGSSDESDAGVAKDRANCPARSIQAITARAERPRSAPNDAPTSRPSRSASAPDQRSSQMFNWPLMRASAISASRLGNGMSRSEPRSWSLVVTGVGSTRYGALLRDVAGINATQEQFRTSARDYIQDQITGPGGWRSTRRSLDDRPCAAGRTHTGP